MLPSPTRLNTIEVKGHYPSSGPLRHNRLLSGTHPTTLPNTLLTPRVYSQKRSRHMNMQHCSELLWGTIGHYAPLIWALYLSHYHLGGLSCTGLHCQHQRHHHHHITTITTTTTTIISRSTNPNLTYHCTISSTNASFIFPNAVLFWNQNAFCKHFINLVGYYIVCIHIAKLEVSWYGW